MIYHVIVALNSAGKRKIGAITAQLEKRGLELLALKKKITPPSLKEFPSLTTLVLQYQLEKTKAMKFYHVKFSDLVLERKLNHFFRNNIELVFEGEKSISPDTLWIDIKSNIFNEGRKLPLLFIVRNDSEKTFDGCFISDSLNPNEPNKLDPRTIVPLGK